LRFLLDTCTFLWWTSSHASLSRAAKQIIDEKSNEVFLSCVSAWEITVKYSIGRLSLPVQADVFVPTRRDAGGILSLMLDEETALYEQKLPSFHADPFDRMLICQAIVQNLQIITPDPLIQRYPVKVIW
jgi:PIN domain nuclease of toxin-antitoxin system